MKTVPLYGKKAAGRVALVDDEDYDLVMQYRWNVYEYELPNGGVRGPYAYANRGHGRQGRTTIKMHRLLVPGIPHIDHRDGNGLNNQRSNLRPATKVQNAANSRKTRADGTRTLSSRFKGVSWDADGHRWRAQIRRRYLGRFADEVEAAQAYDAAAREAFGEFARLNFPDAA